jgi:hypothetical protein
MVRQNLPSIGQVLSVVEVVFVVWVSVGRIAAVGTRMGLSGMRRPSRPRHKRGDKYQESWPIPAEVAKSYRVGRPESNAYEK